MESEDHPSSRWKPQEFEEEDFFPDRKAGRQQRKIAVAKDRSKHKKTDRDKWQKAQVERTQAKLAKETDLLKGRVISIASEGIFVDYEGTVYSCFLRGLLKKEKTLMKNLVVVGDFVLFEKQSNLEGSIVHVEPRFSILSRADNLSHRKEQLIAANIDQVLITTSVVNPALKPSLVDRYIIATHKGGMDPIVIVNKIDLLDSKSSHNELLEQEKELYQQFLDAYALSGIPIISVSTTTGEGLDALRTVMKDKASVFSGQSGVGKSSLINAITGLNLRIGDVVERTRKGSHTTTMAQLLPLSFGGWCIDTPGIKSFGVWDLKKEEIKNYFPEIQEESKHCKFPDCHHHHEPGCAVEKAIEDGKISFMRYQSYLGLIETIDEEHLRR